jgi:UDP-3-O-[3-hydroxymyristoyl] glucosamine N-acyltransferase
LEIPIKQIVDDIHDQCRVLGNRDGHIRNFSPINQANNYSLCFCKDPGEKALDMIKSSQAGVIICSDKLNIPPEENRGKTLVQVSNPRLTYSRLLAKYFSTRPQPGIHPTSIVDSNTKIGSGVHVGPYCCIGECQIGDNTTIESQVSIDHGARVGKNVIIRVGAVVGTETIGFERNGEGELEPFPQLGSVIIEDDVELCAHCVVCRGSLSDTVIGRGTKVDNLARIGHGVRIGDYCIIAGNTIICGSVNIGNHSWIGPMVCIREHLSIGNRVVVGAGSVVHRDIPDNTIVTGSPARPISAHFVKKTY